MASLIVIRNDYPDEAALGRVINYVTRSQICGGYAVLPEEAISQFKLVQQAWHQQRGDHLIHFVVAFSLYEASRITIDEVLAIGFQLGQLFESHQLVYAVHLDTTYLHLHCVMNPVSFRTGKRYADGLHGFYKVRDLLRSYFPRSCTQIFHSFPLSDVNRFTFSAEDDFLRLDG